jgi:cysteine desulfurase family protein (TIGR01976 family)
VNQGGAHAPSRRITAAKEAVRAKTATFLHADGPESVVFGPNATTLVTLIAGALAHAVAPGDEIVVTSLDHHANVDPWRALAARGAVVRTWRPRGPEAMLDVADLRALLGPRTRLVALTAASNALGTRPDVAAASAAAREVGAWTMVDLVHAAPHVLPDVQSLGADLAVMSPYKVIAPHLGVAYLSPAVRAALTPPRLAFIPAHAPAAWEPGTQAHEAIVGWGAALDTLIAAGGPAASDRAALEAAYAAIGVHEDHLAERLLAILDRAGMVRYGLRGVRHRTATVAFNHPELPPAAVATALAASGVAVASGHYYAHGLMMDELGLADRGGAVRVSALHYSDDGDLDAFEAALGRL